MFEFLGLPKDAFGLEITDAAIRIMKLACRGGKLVVSAVSWMPLEDDVVRNGDVKDVPKLTAAIKEALSNAAEKRSKPAALWFHCPRIRLFYR